MRKKLYEASKLLRWGGGGSWKRSPAREKRACRPAAVPTEGDCPSGQGIYNCAPGDTRQHMAGPVAIQLHLVL